MAIFIYLALTLFWTFVAIWFYLAESVPGSRNIVWFAVILMGFNLFRLAFRIGAWRRRRQDSAADE